MSRLTFPRYLWVDLQLNDLARVPETEISMQLKLLPAELEDTYLSMFRRMTALPQTTKSLIQMCFLWAFHAKEIVDNSQFRDAVALKHKMAGVQENPYNTQILTEVTFGLLTLYNLGFKRVWPIHFSLKEFATHPSKKHPSDLQEVLPDSETADAKMAMMCLQHILADVEPDHPMSTCLFYCGRYFDSHIQGLTTIPEELWNMLDHILIKEPESMKKIMAWRFPSHQFNQPNFTCVGNPRSLDRQTFMRCTKLHQVPAIWDRYKSIDESPRNYPKDYFFLAATLNLDDILNNIISQGINPNKVARDGLTALHLTGISMHVDLGYPGLSTIAILLNAGADWNFDCSKMSSKIGESFMPEYQTPLNYFIQSKIYAAVQVVVKHKSFNFANYVKTLPLQRAEFIRHLVVEQGADINQRDEYGDTALTIAKEDGHEEFVKILEELGASE
jgi:hypothetical protein